MDADGSHQPEQLGRLLDAADGADLVIGSRRVEGGAVVNWPWHRRLISWAGTTYARIMLGIPVHDATAGYRVLRRSTLERLDLERFAGEGYCFQIDMTRCVHAVGMSMVEVPVTFVERERGESKMSRGDRPRGALAGDRVGSGPAASRTPPTPATEAPRRGLVPVLEADGLAQLPHRVIELRVGLRLGGHQRSQRLRDDVHLLLGRFS